MSATSMEGRCVSSTDPRSRSASVREICAAEPALLDGLCALLEDAVHGGASVGFFVPLARATAERYWREVFDALGDRLRLWIAVEEGAVVGSVQLAPCTKENGRHRAELQKLLVHSSRRGRGIASAMMAAVETAALRSRISLLVLDTLRESAAEQVYAHLGWTRAGEIPRYAASPDGELHTTVYYYKLLTPRGVGEGSDA
jgi:GNAT superfamily N-acetyltransferase